MYLGSNSNEAGVQSSLRIANASFDPCNEAVVKESVTSWMLFCTKKKYGMAKGIVVGCHLLLVEGDLSQML